MENLNLNKENQEILGKEWNETAVLADEIKDILPEDISKLDQSKFSPKTRKLIMGAALVFSSLGFAEAQTTYGSNVPSNSPSPTGYSYGQQQYSGLSANDERKLRLEQTALQVGIPVATTLVVSGIAYLAHHHAMKKELKRQKKEHEIRETERKLIEVLRSSEKK